MLKDVEIAEITDCKNDCKKSRLASGCLEQSSFCLLDKQCQNCFEKGFIPSICESENSITGCVITICACGVCVRSQPK